MSDLTDKLVIAVQKGQIPFGEVVSRLNDQEMKEFNTSVENFSKNEYEREAQGLGKYKWPMRIGGAAVAGLGAALIPEAIGGAGMGSAIKSGLMTAGSSPAARYGIGGLIISQLPPGLREAAEMAMLMTGMRGGGAGKAAGAAAEAEAGALAKPTGIRSIETAPAKPPMTDEEYFNVGGRPRPGTMRDNPTNQTFGPTKPTPEQSWPPNVELGGPATLGRAPRKPGMFSNMADQGGESSIQYHNTPQPSVPSGPTSAIRPPTPAGPRPPMEDFDEADKRKVMFGGAGDPSVRPSERSAGKFSSVSSAQEDMNKIMDEMFRGKRTKGNGVYKETRRKEPKK